MIVDEKLKLQSSLIATKLGSRRGEPDNFLGDESWLRIVAKEITNFILSISDIFNTYSKNLQR